MLLDIITYPDSVLKTPAVAVENIDGALQEMIDNMIETMYRAPGIGLAANQVGSLSRVIVFDRSPREPGPDPAVLINPEIVDREGSIVHEEACLSVRDYSAEVKRNFQVEARGLDRHGNPVSFDAEDLLAVCLQHEIDHLNGVLFIDHLSTLKRALYKKRLKKILESES
jgi:peptide deformylase